MNVTSVEHIQKKSPLKKECEDAFVLNEQAGIYGVLDGATPLVCFKDEAGHNGAYLAAQIFKTKMERLKGGEELVKAVEEANLHLKDEMERYAVQTELGEERWSTCVAVVKVMDDQIHYVQLGDSMILVEDENGKFMVVTIDSVKGISERAKKKRVEGRKDGEKIPPESYYDIRMNKLRYNRRLANVEGGYTVANGMPEVMDYLDQGVINGKGVRSLLLISDGLFHPELTLEETYQRIREVGLEGYVHELTEHLNKHSLHIDDRTAVWIKFN
ncbi:protein phosphatase 2C domain-containing protein [Halobacillus sp. Nhm2S1]|uniref:protein phosphatase 2C domain-containing protein n=1 Tax=Halobacillus sp. Nhm2S1 TaxID=2866716 RepID=UPI001C73783C|nr:protein phosphatase 2C domain-containing protein [Halobacillus sp. Nhm2S1]MBX0359264.1 protein phosphatase 2C domain-containing protein [Halobacillus sp. Nhm2S1]